MTPRQQRLVAAADACRNSARSLEMDYPRADLDDPMVPLLRRELVMARQKDVASLKLAEATLMAIAEDADGYAVLLELRAKKRWAFDSCVELARQELADKPSGIEQVRAA